jgi:hypothetical protein
VPTIADCREGTLVGMKVELRKWDMVELQAAARRGGPPTADDVSITNDGRRLESKEALLAFLDEVNRERSVAAPTIARYH